MSGRDELAICKNLGIGYSEILKENISFSMRQGEIVFVKGKNGSGKSTLIKTILGKLPAKAGSFQWNVDSQKISYLPQVTNSSAHFSYTLKEILDIYEVPQKYRSYLDSSIMPKRWVDSSGGEKQKTMILTRLTESTQILVLDEPFNHLDIQTIDSIQKLLSTLVSNELKISLLLISHFDVDFGEIPLTEVML